MGDRQSKPVGTLGSQGREPFARWKELGCRPAMRSLLSILFAVWITPASAQTITDGDTIKLNGTTYRLWGIDAPETKQWCGDYPAGVMATAVLETLIKGRGPVICEPKDTDRYGRTVAICRVDGRDLSKAMVRLGMAWAFTRYSKDYLADEEQARAENLGVHARNCQPAWDWRAAQRH